MISARSMEAGVAAVEQYLAAAGLTQQFSRLMLYIRRYWMERVGPAGFSVYMLPRRTNNAVENFYFQLVRNVGARPSIWIFTDTLVRVEHSHSSDYQRLQRGVPIARPRRRVHITNDAVIVRRSEELDRGQLTVSEFLLAVNHTADHLTNNFAVELDQVEQDPLGFLGEDEVFNVPNIPRPQNNPYPVQIVPNPVDLPHQPLEVNVPVIPNPVIVPDPQNAENPPQLDVIVDPEVQQQRLQIVCSVCWDANINRAIIPCGHMVCERCSAELLRRPPPQNPRHCPLCRGYINDFLVVYPMLH